MTMVKATRIYRSTPIETVTIEIIPNEDIIFIRIIGEKSSKLYEMTRTDWEKLQENT